MIRIAVQQEPIDLAVEQAGIRVDGAGGISTFTGLVRADEGVTALELEHYPGATEAALTRLAEDASKRWPLMAVAIVHRVGMIEPGEPVVFVGTASAHRSAALESCAYLIDRLKTDAPFWKREIRATGAEWVAARDSDSIAAARWND